MGEDGQIIVVIMTLVIVCMCVILHNEALGLTSRLVRPLVRPRGRMIVTILAIVTAHVVEIWLFAFGYYLCVGIFELGDLVGIDKNGIGDFAYYSIVVYTTVGFGDIVPVGGVRFMTGMEALSGLVLITWSASFAFLEMQRHWNR